ncbi:MAG: Rpn family recombination-promoting nuclease/putative transposase [Raineya sp.]|nr:Rpn family recombination-promoting nuclease/putative transposase [Raineya sp.]
MGKKLVRFDWAIKRLLRNKANFVVLEGFLSELLFEDIKIKEILESESNQESWEDKYNRVDILTENSRQELVIIEIQNTYEIDYFHRMVYGASKAIAEHLNLGEPYASVRKVISINIVYFDLGQGQDYIYKGVTTFQGLHYNDILQLSEKQKSTFAKTLVSDIFPEYYIIKVNQFNDVAKDTLDEWIYFLKNSEVRDDFRAKGLKEAREALDIMRLDKENQYSYNRYLDYLHWKASEALNTKLEAEEKAKQVENEIRQDEKMKNMLETAKKAIQEGLSNELIIKITNLPLEIIEKLRKELDK